MTAVSADMRTSQTTEYALGYSQAEHERLIRQATLIASVTERLFHEAGIGPGQRVLDLGSGLGDVAMVAAKIVGPSGEVVGIERDEHSIARANVRVAAAGLNNVTFLQTDVTGISSAKPFDAAVGRFILMFLPDPFSALKSVARLVHPGGVLAFQEPTWAPMLAMAARLPLCSRVLGTIHEIFLRSGPNPEMGMDLYRGFQQVGLGTPKMHIDMLVGADSGLISVFTDLLCSVRPLAEQHGVSLHELGDFQTLAKRVEQELESMNTVISLFPIVSAWSRKP
jgi:protein-L-isoaspartate O-methyltransferase